MARRVHILPMSEDRAVEGDFAQQLDSMAQVIEEYRYVSEEFNKLKPRYQEEAKKLESIFAEANEKVFLTQRYVIRQTKKGYPRPETESAYKAAYAYLLEHAAPEIAAMAEEMRNALTKFTQVTASFSATPTGAKKAESALGSIADVFRRVFSAVVEKFRSHTKKLGSVLDEFESLLAGPVEEENVSYDYAAFLTEIRRQQHPAGQRRLRESAEVVPAGNLAHAKVEYSDSTGALVWRDEATGVTMELGAPGTAGNLRDTWEAGIRYRGWAKDSAHFDTREEATQWLDKYDLASVTSDSGPGRKFVGDFVRGLTQKETTSRARTTEARLSTQRAREVAQQIATQCKEHGWEYEVGPSILRITKHFAPNDRDAYVDADSEWYDILSLLPSTSAGSTWGTDGSGVGGLSAIKSGRFVMNKSGGSGLVLKALRNLGAGKTESKAVRVAEDASEDEMSTEVCQYCGRDLTQRELDNNGSVCDSCAENEDWDPAEDDITTEDDLHWYQSGKLYHTGDRKSLKAKMDKDQFWPNVWMISDHGNAENISRNLEEGVRAVSLQRESLNTHCETYLATDGQWYLEFANRSDGRRDEADTYGPFASEDEVDQYVRANFANPGGSYTDRSGDRPVPTRSPNGSRVKTQFEGHPRTGRSLREDETVSGVTGHPDLDAFLATFPDDATGWGDATDEIRDVARMAREIYTELDLDRSPGDWETDRSLPQPLDFRGLKTPADWNTQAKKYIVKFWRKMSQQAKDELIQRVSQWFGNNEESESADPLQGTLDRLLQTILSDAIDGGIVGWAKVRRLQEVEVGEDNKLYIACEVKDDMDPKDPWHPVGLQSMHDAMQKIASGKVQVSPDVLRAVKDGLRDPANYWGDADTADAVVQVAAYGEIVFG